MKNFRRILMAFTIAATIGTGAFADGNAFTPLDFDKSTTTPAVNSIDTAATDAVGNEDIQNAILKLDNAQVGIRNDLVNYKAKYADVDAQYKLIKNERAVLKKQVSTTERRIKSIERSKEKLRKNML